MHYLSEQVATMLFLSIGAVSLFSFVAVASWSDARRKERVAYYKNDMLKKVAESQGGAAVLELLREQEATASRKQIEGMKIGGLLAAGVGIALLIFLKAIVRDEPVYLAGLFPLLTGIAMFAYAHFFAPRQTAK
jgi:hypothetical protein